MSELAAALPDAYTKPDKAAGVAQKRFFRWTTWLLVANVGAALIGAVGLTGVAGQRAAAVAVALFALGVFLAARLGNEKPKQRWYDLRAAAESAKSLAIQYAVGGGRFGVADANAESAYRADIEAIPSSLPSLPPLGVLGDPITDGMVGLRERSLEERRRVYVSGRVNHQRRWYANRAKLNDDAATRWRAVLFAFQVAGIVAGTVMVFGYFGVNFLGIAAATTAAAAAWLRTKDHEGLAEAYRVTERDVGQVAALAEQVTNETEWGDYVEDAEAAFSREHTLWLARRG